jgi:hypothetical protein
MKFPSIQTMVKGLINSFLRFAPAIISVIAGTTVAIMITYEPFYDNDYLYRVIICAGLALPLFIAIRLFCEKSETSLTFRFIYYLIATALLVGYFFTLPNKPETVPMVRFVLLLAGMHLLVSIAAFTGKGEFNGFWQFNKALFLRFLTSALFSAVLYAGLALALLAIDKLFNADIDGKVYARLWIIIAGLFNTWFFLAGVPKNIRELQVIEAFPKGLKIFTQYILLPLVFIYLLILYAYALKIIISWNFPSGWLSYLVLYFSGAGIFSLLLIYPIKELEGNKWMKIIWKWFYIVLMPMLVLLAIAVWKRIDQYGVTENRYFIVVLNLWLALISLYFIFSKTKSIKIIPLTLCILAFITSFGPWGAFSISRNSQFRLLEKTLTEAKMMEDGKFNSLPDNVSFKQKQRIVSIVDYLDKSDALYLMKPLFKQDIDSIIKPDSARWVDKSAKILTLMGIDKWEYYYDYRGEGNEDSLRFSYYAPAPTSYVVKDFDYYFSYNKYSYSDGIKAETKEDIKSNTSYFELGKDDSIAIKFSKSITLDFIKDRKSLIKIDLTAVLDKVNAYMKAHPQDVSHNNFPSEIMMIKNENDAIKTSIYFSQIAGYKNKTRILKISNLNAVILVKFKSEDSKVNP